MLFLSYIYWSFKNVVQHVDLFVEATKMPAEIEFRYAFRVCNKTYGGNPLCKHSCVPWKGCDKNNTGNVNTQFYYLLSYRKNMWEIVRTKIRNKAEGIVVGILKTSHSEWNIMKTDTTLGLVFPLALFSIFVIRIHNEIWIHQCVLSESSKCPTYPSLHVRSMLWSTRSRWVLS